MKKTIAILLTLLMTAALAGCTNGGARPVSAYDSLKAALDDYGTQNFQSDLTYTYQFIRSIAGHVQRPCARDDYKDWEMTRAENAASYTKTIPMFGYDAEVAVGIKDQKDMVMAVAVSFTTGDPEQDRRMAADMMLSVYENVGGSYEARKNDEKITDKEMRALLNTEEAADSLSVIWPKSSVKWSMMLSYQITEEGSSISIYVM